MLRTQKSTDCSPVPPTRALWKTRGKQMGRKQVVGPPRGHSGKESACQSWRRKTRMIDPGLKKIPWRRAWQPTPVFLPGESHGQRSLAGYSPWGHKESDKTRTLLSFPGGSDGKEFSCSARDLGLIPGLRRSPTGGHATHSSILVWRIPMDRGAC